MFFDVEVNSSLREIEKFYILMKFHFVGDYSQQLYENQNWVTEWNTEFRFKDMGTEGEVMFWISLSHLRLNKV